jgi:N-acetyl-anhydromuramyl-L-alanine amidase AmpD
MMDGLPNYSVIDVGGTTNPGVNDNRRLSPVGTCIHTTSGVNSLDWLTSGSKQAGTPASADYLIERQGTTYKISPSGRYAYHAGKSRLVYAGHEYTNDEVSQLLIGVELECLDNQQVTYEQIDALAALIVQLSVDWTWRFPYIIYGHYEVARPVGRRNDPQGLDYGSLFGRLYVRSMAAHVPGLV